MFVDEHGDCKKDIGLQLFITLDIVRVARLILLERLIFCHLFQLVFDYTALQFRPKTLVLTEFLIAKELSHFLN